MPIKKDEAMTATTTLLTVPSPKCEEMLNEMGLSPSNLLQGTAKAIDNKARDVYNSNSPGNTLESGAAPNRPKR